MWWEIGGEKRISLERAWTHSILVVHLCDLSIYSVSSLYSFYFTHLVYKSYRSGSVLWVMKLHCAVCDVTESALNPVKGLVHRLLHQLPYVVLYHENVVYIREKILAIFFATSKNSCADITYQ